jgi:hypothetical protein
VHRQRQAYQAKASEDFARGEIRAALQAYDDRGQIVWCDSLAEARARAVAAQASITGPSFLYGVAARFVQNCTLSRSGHERRANFVEGPEVCG